MDNVTESKSARSESSDPKKTDITTHVISAEPTIPALRRRDSSYRPHPESAKPATRNIPDNPSVEVSEGATSNAENEKTSGYHLAGSIPPPYDLKRLAELVEMSSELRKTVETMATNTVGFGHQLKLRPGMTEEQRERLQGEIQKEKSAITAWLQALHPKHSVRKIRFRVAYDKWSVGNGYLELLHSPTGRLTGIDHVRGHSVWLMEEGEDLVPVKVPVVLPHEDFKIEYITKRARFRRFVQILRTGKKVYFKEAGDPRVMSAKTGKYETPEDPIPYEEHATSLIHESVYAPDSSYGIPLHIAEERGIVGSFQAAEINYNSIDDNNVPAYFIKLFNSEFTKGTIQRLKDLTKQIRGSRNRSKFIMLEAESVETDGAMPGGNASMDIEALKHLQTNDEMFQAYDKNNNAKIRGSHRLPALFTGVTDTYNRNTADAARDVTDEQVFAPARDDSDEPWNRHVLLNWGVRFHVFVSNSPNVTNAQQLLRMLAVAEKSGGLTPRIARTFMERAFGEDLGPLPKGIDPDIPYSIQFAMAQKHGEVPGADGTATPDISEPNNSTGGTGPSEVARQAAADELELLVSHLERLREAAIQAMPADSQTSPDSECC